MSSDNYIKGDVVVIPFPFSDLSGSKRRPALIIASIEKELILCQITSQPHTGAIKIKDKDFDSGGLQKISFVRLHKLFTADTDIILSKKGKLKKEVINSVITYVIEILKS